ncbi:hypothetical protein M2347_003266 [Chryseobacterium sp. H1D6B]|uniref:DUF922 domain-containing protein n=1 Tax=Chryseobacterium sp. H1D6B TaxID=2940588 RepID=UPI0015CC0AC8|nr:DUF922 domain-containing protein [Chryseobacterium sp. H1D6B]MDH6253539.1 hypothetical protein [Chryseobacterium sp. H1D6B]
MKWIFLFCFLTANLLFSQKIIWKEGLKLNWSNFKSNINNQRGTNVVAYTNCGWVYSVVRSTNPKSPVKVKIETIFNEYQSWKDAKKINDYVLGHEQKHFDIAEVFARKLRKKVQEKIKTSGDFNKNFQNLYNKILSDYRRFQVSYDTDTNNGINEEKQAEYDVKIAEELDNLKSYKAS